MTAPLVPVDVNLRGLEFMPLDVNRLRDSDLAIRSTGDEFRAAVLLWCKAWTQVPASSLPNDDVVLADYAGFGRDLKGWRKVRAGALRGFVLCDDGRLYHPVIAEKAVAAWQERTEYNERRDNEAARQQNHRNEHKRLRDELREYGVVMPWSERIETLREALQQQRQRRTHTPPVTRTGPSPATAKRGTGRGREEGTASGSDFAPTHSDTSGSARESASDARDDFDGHDRDQLPDDGRPFEMLDDRGQQDVRMVAQRALPEAMRRIDVRLLADFVDHARSKKGVVISAGWIGQLGIQINALYRDGHDVNASITETIQRGNCVQLIVPGARAGPEPPRQGKTMQALNALAELSDKVWNAHESERAVVGGRSVERLAGPALPEP